MNTSKFYITYDTMRDLDLWNVVLGRVFKNFDMLQEIELAGTDDGTPVDEVVLTKCTINWEKASDDIFYVKLNYMVNNKLDKPPYYDGFSKERNDMIDKIAIANAIWSCQCS